MNDKSKSFFNRVKDAKFSGDGISFTGCLTIAFIVLKLLGDIKWSWIWVLAPYWAWWAFTLVICVLYILFRLVVDLCIIKKAAKNISKVMKK